MKKYLLFTALFVLVGLLCVSCSGKVKTICDICGEKEECTEMENAFVCDYCMREYEENKEEYQEFLDEYPDMKYSDYKSYKSLSNLNQLATTDIEQIHYETDCANYESTALNCMVAVTDSKAYQSATQNDYEIIMSPSGTVLNKNGSPADKDDPLYKALEAVGSDSIWTISSKLGDTYIITVTRDVTVIRTQGPQK